MLRLEHATGAGDRSLEAAAWGIENLGNCHLGKCTFGKFGKYPLEKLGKWKPCLRFREMHHAHGAAILNYIIRTIDNFLPSFEKIRIFWKQVEPHPLLPVVAGTVFYTTTPCKSF